ncbi:MAG: hypothetical protein OSA51_10620 [Octadecabacter sp.]|nr:hypothetical protein [Octadecabacter sp.]
MKVHPGRLISSRDDNITVAGSTYVVGLPLESVCAPDQRPAATTGTTTYEF